MSDYADRYGLPAEVEAWRTRAQRFAVERLAPLSREADRERRFPVEVIPEMAAEGLIGAPLPREHGGGGVGALADAVIAEEIGRVDGSVRGFLAVHVGLVARTIAHFGTPEQQRTWLPRMVKGEAIGCFCLTEPGAGSDAGALAARALDDGDHVRLTGEKTWITNARLARVALVFANAEPALGRKGLECYLVPTDTEGWQTEPMEGIELGHRASDHARVHLRDVRVPASSRLGPRREGFRVAMGGLDHGRLNVAAGATGIQAACLDLAVEWSRSRRQFGSRIGDFQQVGAALADMKVALEASRLLVHHAARRMDRGSRATAETSAAKLFATEAALRASTQALRLHGARGYTDELPLERHYRDAIALTIYEGTSEIQRVILSRDLLGKDRSEGTA
ncbi:MAG TPA: acyl-CoA dehydrogenase family protein [Planctomycetota bacterium]|nr:acyl-CoA dehydrogenase family protein [Planctomycetota bacterium]